MLEKSDTSVAQTLAQFGALNVEVCLLVPTATGLDKSIMDATRQVREFLCTTNFHNYDRQDQGPENKVTKKAFYVYPDRLEETKVSLYRPNTKSGDPRIWFANLKRHVEAFNLLALIVSRDAIYIINCSRDEIIQSALSANTPLAEIVSKTASPVGNDEISSELLEKVRAISKRGFITTHRPGDTGVGMTLETLLEIEANSSKTPDYKGIEIKSKRVRGGKSNRTTLFSQVPNWKLSPIGSAKNLLATYGYERDGKLRLNHQITSTAPNSIGFILDLDRGQDWLRQCHQDQDRSSLKHVTTWEMEKLRSRLREKHRETFWVQAHCRGKKETEQFHYVEVKHTRSPRVQNLEPLFESGAISVDYLMSQKGDRVRDHGYLFKMHADDMPALFPLAAVHALI
jgi:hypothetical protein